MGIFVEENGSTTCKSLLKQHELSSAEVKYTNSSGEKWGIMRKQQVGRDANFCFSAQQRKKNALTRKSRAAKPFDTFNRTRSLSTDEVICAIMHDEWIGDDCLSFSNLVRIFSYKISIHVSREPDFLATYRSRYVKQTEALSVSRSKKHAELSSLFDERSLLVAFSKRRSEWENWKKITDKQRHSTCECINPNNPNMCCMEHRKRARRNPENEIYSRSARALWRILYCAVVLCFYACLERDFMVLRFFTLLQCVIKCEDFQTRN